MGDVANIAVMAAEAFDPCFILTQELNATRAIARSTIRTSRLIVLTEESAPVGKAVSVKECGDLIVFGDVVRVAGTISALGRTVKISCRCLEFHPGSDGTSGIIVDGEKGEDGKAKLTAATAGQDGTNASRGAKQGQPGENGENGGVGRTGGDLQIYCETLTLFTNVKLQAEGGRGGNGADGQEGGGGGNGFSGFGERAARVLEDGKASRGGPGGCGGNGGDGGLGGKGGRVQLYVMNVNNGDKYQLTVSALPGFGGNGGRPGKGGRGGNGGSPAPDAYHQPYYDNIWGSRYLDGGDSGGGGICGLPGYFGYAGNIGTVSVGIPLKVKPGSETQANLKFHWDWLFVPGSESETSLLGRLMTTVLVRFADERPRFGQEGESFKDPDECAAPGTPGFANNRGGYGMTAAQNGAVGPSNRTRNPKPPRTQPAVGPLEKLKHRTIDYSNLEVDTDQLEMHFDQIRSRYLLVNVESSASDAALLMQEIQWLVSVANARKDTNLLGSASATLNNLRLGNNIFGQDAEFSVLGLIDQYKADLKTMLELFLSVENAQRQINIALNNVAEQQAYLRNVIKNHESLMQQLERARKEKVKRHKEVKAEIEVLEESRLDLAATLKSDFDNLAADVQGGFGLSGADFCSVFNQLSFTNRDLTTHSPGPSQGGVAIGGVMATGAMIFSQVGDLVTKAFDNVATDTGNSINKEFLIRRMQFLEKDVKTLADLKQSKDGLLKADPSAEYRLLATREQVESICSNFYKTFTSAKQLSEKLDAYIHAVTTRNEKVEEYNQVLSDLLYVRAELDKAGEQCGRASASLQKTANPELPARARFSTALYRHAKEQCVEQLYMASRVYTLQFLNPYDAFVDALGKLTSGAAPGEINSAALNTGLIDLMCQVLQSKQKSHTSIANFKPMGDHCCITLTPASNALLFTNLRAGRPGSFRIRRAAPETTIDQSPFAGMAEVRLTHVRCTAKGMITSDNNIHCIDITHAGVESFVTEDGQDVDLHHNSITVPYQYDANVGGQLGEGALDEEHTMMGPFGEWFISISKANKGLDLSKLESIKVEFEGTYRAFLPGLRP